MAAGSEGVTVRRVIACFAPGAAGATASLARLMAEVQAELVGLFIEDAELLRFAALPFAEEVGLAGRPRAVDAAVMERALRAQAAALRDALAAALGICFASGVQAQSSVGSIFGDAAANSAVTIENLDTGTSREVSSDASGHFTFTQLQPGRYRVTSGGVTREVQVRVGTGTQVALVGGGGDATTLDAVTVVGSSAVAARPALPTLP